MAREGRKELAGESGPVPGAHPGASSALPKPQFPQTWLHLFGGPWSHSHATGQTPSPSKGLALGLGASGGTWPQGPPFLTRLLEAGPEKPGGASFFLNIYL